MNMLRRTQASTAHVTGVTGSGVLGAGARNGLRRLVTTWFRNPTTPVEGAVGAIGTTAAAAAGVVNALAAVSTFNSCSVTAALDSVTAAENSFAFLTTSATVDLTLGRFGEAVVRDLVAAFAVTECVYFDPVVTGFDV